MGAVHFPIALSRQELTRQFLSNEVPHAWKNEGDQLEADVEEDAEECHEPLRGELILERGMFAEKASRFPRLTARIRTSLRPFQLRVL